MFSGFVLDINNDFDIEKWCKTDWDHQIAGPQWSWSQFWHSNFEPPRQLNQKVGAIDVFGD